MVFICSPNNPTGTAVDADTVLALYDAAQAAKADSAGALVVIDEAYGEFSHRPSLLSLIEGRPNLVVSRTMSKAFGAAGLRLGYLAADAAVVDAVQLVRLPYHLSSVTQATALAALEHTDTLLKYVEQLKTERDRLVTELRAAGCQVVDSDANFVQFGLFEDSHSHLAGHPRPRRAGPGQRRARLAARQRRHPGRERRVPRRRARGPQGARAMSRTADVPQLPGHTPRTPSRVRGHRASDPYRQHEPGVSR